MRRIKHIAALALLATVPLTSCEHKELCYDHPHAVSLTVRFDWSADPGAAPESMSLYLFPKDGGEPLRYEFVGREGGLVHVPSGDYDAICLNSDTENMAYRNTESYWTFEIHTKTTEPLAESLTRLGVRSESAPRPEDAEGQRVAKECDMLWTAVLTGIALPEAGGSDTITLCPDRAVRRYRVEIVGAENLEHARGLSASLTGKAGGVLPGQGTVSAEAVTVPFEMSVTVPDAGADAGREVVAGELLLFGHCPETVSNEHALTVYAVMSDGSKYAYTFDTGEVTRQIHEAPDQRDILIRLEGLPLPEPIGGGGGFIPDVEEWESEEIVLPV